MVSQHVRSCVLRYDISDLSLLIRLNKILIVHSLLTCNLLNSDITCSVGREVAEGATMCSGLKMEAATTTTHIKGKSSNATTQQQQQQQQQREDDQQQQQQQQSPHQPFDWDINDSNVPKVCVGVCRGVWVCRCVCVGVCGCVCWCVCAVWLYIYINTKNIVAQK